MPGSRLEELKAGQYRMDIRVMEEHDPFLLINDDGTIDQVFALYLTEAEASLVAGSLLIAIFVVHWTVCEKISDTEMDELLGQLVLSTQQPDRGGHRRRQQ